MRGSAAPSRSPTDLESVFGRQEAAWTPGRPGGAGIGAGRGSMAGLLRPQGSRPRASAGPGPKVATVRMSRGGIRKEGFKGTPGRGRKVVTAYVPAGRPRQPYDQEAYEYEDAGAYQGPVVYVDGRGRGRGRRGGRGGAWDTGCEPGGVARARCRGVAGAAPRVRSATSTPRPVTQEDGRAGGRGGLVARPV